MSVLGIPIRGVDMLSSHAEGSGAVALSAAADPMELAVDNLLRAAFARERLRDALRAVVEDVLGASPTAVTNPRDRAWLERCLDEIAEQGADGIVITLGERLGELLRDGPPDLLERVASSRHWSAAD
jgi:hypothetical protein